MKTCCEGSPHIAALQAAHDERETWLDVEGATCGACAARIEAALRALPGVRDAAFSLATRRVRVVLAEATTVEALCAAVARAGYRACLRQERPDRKRSQRIALGRTGVAGLAMMQVMMLAYPVYVADEGTLTWDLERLLALGSLALTIPVMVFSAAPIWQAAWNGLRARHLGMDVPAALGIAAAFAASVYATFTSGPVYYDAVTMFVFFLSAGRYFEAKALAATLGSSEALAQLLPRKAVRLIEDRREEIDPAALRPGDRVWIAAGESAPADCTLLSGASDFNEALLTGESAPAAKRAGEAILAGSVNLSAPVEARVERAGEDQTLALVRRLVERAGAEKPRWAQMADRVAAHFVLGVLLLAAFGAAFWLSTDPARALGVAVAVLVVTCPCALSLATPVALTAGANALASDGVLVTRGRAIEALAAVTRVVFDKTGTLTTGRMHLATADAYGELSRERCLAIAGCLEQAMPHPVAHALVAAAPAAAGRVSEARPVPGAGVEARVDGVLYRVGSPEFCAPIAGSPAPFATHGALPLVALASEGEWLALFRFDDTLRPEAPELLRRLRALGCEASLVSGDRHEVVERVARSVGIADSVSHARPEDKAGLLRQFALRGETVAMVGDGVNDAPGLARAHVAIALGQGAAVARSQADFILLNPSLLAIAGAIETARRARRIIVQNLAWAVAYNALTLPLAFTGVLTPWMASLGMSASSLLVIVNALRLSPRRKPRPGLDFQQSRVPG